MVDISKIKDFQYYAPSLLRIKTNIPTGDDETYTERIIPLTLNESQLKLHKVWEHLLTTVGHVRIIILKARRQGMSTYVEGRVFQKVHINPNTHALIMAHDKDGTNTIFDMSKLFYESLPKSFKPMKRYSSKKELVFENPNERTRYVNPGLRSKIEVFTANKLSSSRSGGYSCGHFSEVAFFPDAETLISATAPTIPDAPGTFIVFESTAEGKGGFFHEEWLRATSLSKKKETNFVPVFFSWLEFHSYTKPFKRCCDVDDFSNNLDPEEKELLVKHKASLEQLHWRKHKILDLSSDIDLFHQEYPTTPEEAFISAGQCYFNRRKIQSLIERCDDPLVVGEITPLGFVENDDGPLSIWEKPQRDCSYMIGIDVGGGTDGGDPSVMEVVKVPKGTPLLEQVAEWRDVIDPVILAGKAIALGNYYNEATLAPEVNNHGYTFLNEVKNHYFNIYRWQYFDRYGKCLTNKLGWETNISTRPLLCDYTSACVNADILIVRSSELAGEMLSFIKRPSVGGEADSGCHDDCVMAFMISIFCLVHSFHTTTILQQLGLSPNPIITEHKHTIISPYDHDNLFLEGNKSDYYSGAQGWLNY